MLNYQMEPTAEENYQPSQYELCKHYQRGYSQTFWEPGEPDACSKIYDLLTEEDAEDDKAVSSLEIKLFTDASKHQCTYFEERQRQPRQSILDAYRANADLYSE